MKKIKYFYKAILFSALFALAATTPSAEAQAPAKPAPWDGFWECDVHENSPLTIEIRNGRYSIRGAGTQAPRNPFGGPPSGAVTSLKDEGWARNLSIPGLASKRKPGKWMLYPADRENGFGPRLGWVSFSGEGSENLCQKIGR